MKHLKKAASVLLALVMALALMAPAFAATGSVLDMNEGSGHTYLFYQVFSATRDEDGSLRQDSFQWGPGFNASAAISALQGNTKYSEIEKLDGTKGNPFAGIVATDTDSAVKVAEVLANYFADGKPYGKADYQKALADDIAKGVVAADMSPVQGENGYVLPFGYWVGFETVGTSTDASHHLVVSDGVQVTIKTKKGESKVDKDIKTRTVDDVEGAWANGALWKEDEDIPFRLVVTLPDDFDTTYKQDASKPYNVVLHDVMSEGLTDVDIKSVQLFGADDDIDNAETVAKATLSRANGDATDGLTYQYVTDGTCTNTPGENGKPAKITGCTFEIKIGNLDANGAAVSRGKLVVNYTAKFDPEKVNIGALGNDNTVHLEVNGEPTNESSVKAFEIELDVDKVNSSEQPLNGAEFTLYAAKKDENNNWVVDDTVNGVLLTSTQVQKTNEAGAPLYTDADGNETTVAENNTPVMINGSHFTGKNLVPGTYILRETKYPDGLTQESDPKTAYTKVDDIVFEVGVNVVEESTVPTLKVNLTYQSNENLSVGEDQNLDITIKNVTGTLLPETGGIGTTIFYIVGGVLVIGAVVLLITKRRASADEE